MINSGIIIDDLAKSGLTVSDVAQLGWDEVKNNGELRKYGFQTTINKQDIIRCTQARLLIPYLNADGKPIFYRLKLYPPIAGAKYLQPIGVSPEPYILPQIWELKQKNTKPLIICEGEKKALALFKNGFSSIGLPGVWSWCQNGKLNHTLGQWNWQGRTVYLCFDNDRNTNAQVLQAEISLGINLALRGAKVHIVEIPKSHKKMGVDNFIVKFSIEDFEELISQAKSIYNAYPKDLERDIQKALIKATENQRFNPERVETVVESFAEHFKWKRTIVKDLLKKLIKKEKEPSKTQLSAEIISKEIKNSFMDEQGRVYVVLQYGEYYPLTSLKFRRLAFAKVINELGETISPQLVRDAIYNLEAIASQNAEVREMFIRTGIWEGKLYYSLGNFQAVEVDKGGWQIVQEPAIFRHFEHQKTQTEPDTNADISDIEKIFDFVNIEDDELKILLLVYLITSFIPQIAHPVLVLYGSQGSGKTTLQRLLIELIDPVKKGEPLSLVSLDDARINFTKYWFIAYDNLSYINQAISDEFCRVSTGGSFSKRKLYSDDEEIFHSYKNVLCISGINTIINAPDLMDRSILIKMERIQKDKVIPDGELYKRINEIKSKVLGAIFNILSEIWGRIEPIPYPLFRMSDFTLYGFHIANAIGYGGERFLKAYANNYTNSNKEMLEGNPVAMTLIKLTEDDNQFIGTTQELLRELRRIAESVGFTEDDLPKNAVSLGKKLNTLKTPLNEIGIVIEEKERSAYRRTIAVYRKANKVQREVEVEGSDEIPF